MAKWLCVTTNWHRAPRVAWTGYWSLVSRTCGKFSVSERPRAHRLVRKVAIEPDRGTSERCHP